ncbi:fragile X mental retardation [Perkinsus chesapeaki]|uniref:Fragile X mental retardation n=1 Tax=Perkinsus chesapeaki TaxID=330153 RepID=A0A7J6LSZ9_PERCH|nr:fragile X mental retardation [Perkinsus chesapeaki]
MAECSTPSTLSGIERDNTMLRYAPIVEIRDDSAPQKWFEGYLADVDVANKTISVVFQDDVWGPKTVPMSQARLAPSLTSKALNSPYDYRPGIGDTVEVRSPATGHAPVSWWTGEVLSIRADEFFYVKNADLHEPIIVERANIRHPVGFPADGSDSGRSQSSIRLDDLRSETVKIPKLLGEWIMSDDGQGCLNQVAIKSGLLKITPRVDSKTGPTVTLIGNQRDIHRAKLLLEVHVKHQKEIQGFHEKRQNMLNALSSRREKLESQESTSFNIDSSLVGDYGVEVNVADKGTAREPDSRRVVIYGPTVEAVNKARAELEYLVERYPIPPDCIGWVIGKRFTTLHEIADSAHLNYARLDESSSDSPCLVICGRRQDLDDARLLLDSHLQYHDVFEDMAKESRELGDEFNRLGDASGIRRGKGKGKGKGAGGKGRSQGARAGRPRKGSDGGKGSSGRSRKWVQVNKEETLPAKSEALSAS